MLQIKKLNLTHKKDLRIILNDFNLVLNDGDKAVIIGEEGNGSDLDCIPAPKTSTHCVLVFLFVRGREPRTRRRHLCRKQSHSAAVA